MASLITPYSGYLVLSFLPPVLWLLFYLREDQHPEPKRLIVLTFISGMLTAVVAVIFELLLLGEEPEFAGIISGLWPKLLGLPIFIFGAVALVEEYLKYFAVKLAVLDRPEFDEPIDAMIYMMTAALGFASLENILFLLPVFGEDLLAGISLTANRFLGANLLHALSSGIVGYALARHIFSPYRRHAVALGVLAASGLHTFFNYLIISQEAIPQSFTMLVWLLVIMAMVVFAEFERLKKKPQIGTNNYTS